MFYKGKRGKTALNAILIAAALVITLAAVINGAYVRDGYSIKVGDLSPSQIKSPRRVINRVATERNKAAAENAAAQIKPRLKKSAAADDNIKNDLDSFFKLFAELRKEHVSIYIPYEWIEIDEPSPTPHPNLTVELSEAQTELLLNLDTDTYNNLSDAVYSITEQTLEQGVQEIGAITLQYVRDEFEKLNFNAELISIGNKIVTSYLQPNIIVDEAATQKAREDIASDYETVYVNKGELIIAADVRISAEVYDLLLNLGLVSRPLSENLIPVAGVLVLVIIIFLLSFLYIYTFHKHISTHNKEAVLLFTLYIITILSAWLLKGRMPYQAVPILFFTMLVSMLLDSKLSLAMNMSVTIICLLIFKGELDFLFFYLISGFLISIISKYALNRDKMFITAIEASVLNFILSVAISLFFDKSYTPSTLNGAAIAAANGIVTVILCIGSLPIWEAAFGIITVLKLQDLANPNNELLRRLTMEAPGTYHHSLIVSNLAETAAYDIGADPDIARVGAYYHDIGKLKYPLYFIENQAGENPHDSMDPYSSVQVIISHVTFGLELASSYKLPQVIRDFISQHHGNSIVKYFYYKYREENPDEDVNEEDFRYNYSPPRTRETALVMLADGVEAAVRSMVPSGKSREEVEAFVRTLIKSSLDGGQLVDSLLTIKDLETIVGSFMRVFKGLYHERIPYPSAPSKPVHATESAKVTKEEADAK